MTGYLQILRLISSAWLLIVLTSCSGMIDEPVLYFQDLTPRPFGYIIGDTIERQITLEARSDLELQYSSLPAKGRINRWLELQHIRVEQQSGQRGRLYRIILRYQVFYAPLEVTMLELPGFDIQLRHGINHIEQTVNPWHFTVAPLRELAIRKLDGLHYLRPDAVAPLLNTERQKSLLSGSLVMLLLSGLGLAYRYGLLPGFSKKRIFSRLNAKLRHLNQQQQETALRLTHQAFNEMNDGPLFAHTIEQFLMHNPRYRVIQRELMYFFELSNRYYFSNRQERVNIRQLSALARLCRDIERGKR